MNVQSVVKDVFAGLIGMSAVAGLGFVAWWEITHGLPFNEPGSLAGVAIAAVAYFYNARAQETQAQATVSTAKTVMNGGTAGPVGPAGPAGPPGPPGPPPAAVAHGGQEVG